MKKKLSLFVIMIMTVCAVFAQSWTSYKGKTLYLATYGAYDESTKSCKHPLVCRFGEYMTIGTNGVLTWNSRYGGANSSYTYSISGKRLNMTPRSGAYDVNDKYIEIIRIDGNSILTRSNNGVYRIYSTVKQPVITGHGAEVTKFWIEHNVVRDNEKGLIVHVDAQFFRVSNHNLRISAYFDHPANCGIQDNNNRYRGYNGVVCTEMNITNNGDDTFITDVQLFLPYKELHLGGEKDIDVACHVFIHDSTLGGSDYLLSKSDFLHFYYQPKQNSGSNISTDAISGAAALFGALLGFFLSGYYY